MLVKPYGVVEVEDPESHRSWTINAQRLKYYLWWWDWKAHHTYS